MRIVQAYSCRLGSKRKAATNETSKTHNFLRPNHLKHHGSAAWYMDAAMREPFFNDHFAFNFQIILGLALIAAFHLKWPLALRLLLGLLAVPFIGMGLELMRLL